jgi:hypothetical protein
MLIEYSLCRGWKRWGMAYIGWWIRLGGKPDHHFGIDGLCSVCQVLVLSAGLNNFTNGFFMGQVSV